MIIDRLAARLTEYLIARKTIEWLQDNNLVSVELSAEKLAEEFAFPRQQKGIIKRLGDWTGYVHDSRT